MKRSNIHGSGYIACVVGIFIACIVNGMFSTRTFPDSIAAASRMTGGVFVCWFVFNLMPGLENKFKVWWAKRKDDARIMAVVNKMEKDGKAS